MTDLNIPFIRSLDERNGLASSTMTSPAVDNHLLMSEGWRHVREFTRDELGLEAQIADWNTAPAGVLEILANRRRCVCKVVVEHGVDFRGRQGTWHGTGFLVAPNLLLTNHHVLNSTSVAENAFAEFNFELPPERLLNFDSVPPGSTDRYRLDPSRLFITSGVRNNGLDFTFVQIDPAAGRKFGFVPMGRGSYKTSKREPTYVIHHPRGRLREVSLDDTELLGDNFPVLHYAADTDVGSSGAPVFNKHGGLVALHHAGPGVTRVQSLYPNVTTKLNDGRNVNNLNEGIKIAAIAVHLERLIHEGGKQASMAADVLRHIGETDTITGYFGALGRKSDADSDLEAVVDLHTGTKSDLDIGFWNIRWFSNGWDDLGRLDAAASVVADLNMDIWGFSEVSPRAVKELCKRIEEKFGQKYRFGFSEPNASEGKQSTAMIWREGTVQGEKIDWPPELDKLLRKDSRDELGLEAVHGKIFNRYPGLFRFRPADGGNSFYVVPLHLKAKSEGSLRRKLASRLLAYAVDKMITDHNADEDWIIGGDFNATLASGDFSELQASNFEPLAAEDEQAGAFTYLKSPKSLIDNIFLSETMHALVDENDFFIVAKDRTIDKFVPLISDHRPISMRIPLSRLTEQNAPDTLDAAVHDLVEQESDSVGDWVYLGLSKRDFMVRNAGRFAKLRDLVNRQLRTQYGAGRREVSDQDLWFIVYAEAGFKNGAMDPQADHSLGERGLLPLPSNIAFWNGQDAPHWGKPMSLEENLYHYAIYLGQLKNKAVHDTSRGWLYRDLFSEPGINGDPVRGAKLLAGVVHGYFLPANYSDGKIPFQRLMDGYARNLPVDDLMRPTKYVHAGTSILRGREGNLKAAEQSFAAF